VKEHPKIRPFGSRSRRRVKVRLPTRPEWLQGEAARTWDELAPQMAKAGWLDALSASGFAVICDLIARAWKLSADLDRLTVNDAVVSGVHAAWLAAVSELREWSDDYFMNPASRVQAGVTGGPEPGA
jgi:hypothetical protein